MTNVREAARSKFSSPSVDEDLKIQITFFYADRPTFDIDNISKPICDALTGIAYNDDSQLIDRVARKRNISGSYRLEGVALELVKALADGQEFVYIELTKVGEEIQQL